MFKLSKAQFNPDPTLKHAINDDSVLSTNMKYFDKEGFELNKLEQAYYRVNGIHTGRSLYHICAEQEWILGPLEPRVGPYFDHCMILTRYDYGFDARIQLEKLARKRPCLNKLLKIKSKYGIDISMEYQWPDGDISEIFHIEIDRHNLNEILEWKAKLEDIVLNTDWSDVMNKIMLRKSDWEGMNSDDQSDWRCRFLGLPRAYDTIKLL
jgi:hypothetical protein